MGDGRKGNKDKRPSCGGSYAVEGLTPTSLTQKALERGRPFCRIPADRYNMHLTRLWRCRQALSIIYLHFFPQWEKTHHKKLHVKNLLQMVAALRVSSHVLDHIRGT